MAIVNPTTSSRAGGLLDQVLAERDNLAGARNPSAQPGAPIRGLVQNPQLGQESTGSSRILAVKPLMNTEAQSVVPAQPTEVPTQPGIQAPAIGGGVVGPNNFQEQPAPPGPAAPGGSQWQDPNPRSNPSPGSSSTPSSISAPKGSSVVGRPSLSTSVFRAPSQSRVTGRIILASLPTKLTPSPISKGTWV